jgi:hypothetical protein
MHKEPPFDRDAIVDYAKTFGLHPFVALGMLVADCMLAALEFSSLGALAALSILVGIALIVPCALVQRYAYSDSLGAAWGKARFNRSPTPHLESGSTACERQPLDQESGSPAHRAVRERLRGGRSALPRQQATFQRA